MGPVPRGHPKSERAYCPIADERFQGFRGADPERAQSAQFSYERQLNLTNETQRLQSSQPGEGRSVTGPDLDIQRSQVAELRERFDIECPAVPVRDPQLPQLPQSRQWCEICELSDAEEGEVSQLPKPAKRREIGNGLRILDIERSELDQNISTFRHRSSGKLPRQSVIADGRAEHRG